MNRKEKEEYFLNKLKTAIPLDNDVFAIFARDKGFCEEFLRVILEDGNLIVIDNEPQKFIPNAYFKGVYLDMMCKLSDKRVVNVEIQLYEEKNEAKRIFYYASMIEEAFVDKGTKYEDISDIIIIYLTKDDIFKLGSTVYDVDMEVVSDTKKIVKKWNCGLQVKYVNTVGLTNKTINEYLKLLSDNVTYNTKYKKTNDIKKDILTIDGGKRSMSVFYELTKDYYEEGVEKGIQQGMIRGEDCQPYRESV